MFKGSLYILNLLCGIIPCDHKFPFPDTTADIQQLHASESVTRDTTMKEWNDIEENNMLDDSGGSNSLIVNTTSGTIQGYWMTVVGGQKIRAFEGIPYAEPPLNEQRFRAPVPVKPRKEIIMATLKGPKCLQYNDITQSRVIGSENCLFLNIYVKRPSQESSKLYPVIIFIHGGAGGFTGGSGNDFGPAYMLQRDIMLVTINYRVGVLGFMSTNDEHSPGNAGLKDQSEAIKWVHDNCEAFNGDKNRIVLMGHDAGAASVHFHMMSFKSRGRFVGGISISGTAFNQWALHTADQALNLTKSFAKALHCPIHGTTHSIVHCLRQQRGDDIVKMQISFLDRWPLTTSLFRPVIEDEYQKEEPFLTETPEEAYQKGTVDRIPWICGQAEDEGHTYLISHLALGTFNTLRKKWNSLAPDFFNYEHLPVDQQEITRRVNWLYFQHTKPIEAPLQTFSDALGTRMMYTGSHKAIQAHSQHGETYAFVFAYKGQYNLANIARLNIKESAVGHGEILGYILNSTNVYTGFRKNDSELVLSNIMVNFISNFAEKLVPEFTTPDNRKYHIWNAVTDARNISFLRLDKKIKMIPEPYFQQILYWESLGIPDSLPLANYSNEIQNVSLPPEAKGFVSTDITVLGKETPADLVPPVELMPGTFTDETNFTAISTTNATSGAANFTTSYSTMTTLKPVLESAKIPSILLTDTSTTKKPTTSKKPITNRWLAQNFVPMPEIQAHLNISSNQSQPLTRPPVKQPSPIDNSVTNLNDFTNYDDAWGKETPYGISVPIFSNIPTSSTGLIEKTKFAPTGNENIFMTKASKEAPSPSENEMMMTMS